MEKTSERKREREERGDGYRSLWGGLKCPEDKEDNVPVGPGYLPVMPILGPSHGPSMPTFDNTRSEKEPALLRIQQALQTISQNNGAFILRLDSLLRQKKQILELKSSTQTSQQNQVGIRPIVPTSATQTSTQPSYSQPRQHVSINQTATILHNLHQPKPLQPTAFLQNSHLPSQPTRSVTQPTATLVQNSQQQKPSLPSQPTRSATQPTATLVQNSQQQKPSLPSQPTRSATQPTATLVQNSQQQKPSLPSQPTRSATQPTATLVQNSQQQKPSLPSQPTRSATQPSATLVQNFQQQKPSLPSQPTATLDQNSQQQKPSLALQPTRDFKATLKEIEAILSNIVGQEGVKSQIRKWGFRLLQDEKRRALGLDVGQRKALHMAFFGNPGTGKTMIARALGKVLHLVGLVSNEEVTEVQRSDLVGGYIGHTGMKTQKKIQEASGGILFVDEAYRLMPQDSRRDFGIEALEEIMAAMNRRDIVVIFAGYTVEMDRLISSNPGLFRRVSNKFYFDDYSSMDMARILHLKMDTKDRDSFTYGYRLDSDCSVEAISELIEEHTTEEQRKKLNGGIVEPLLVNALEHLDLRLDANCTDASSLLTITMEDLEEGLKSLDKLKNQSTGSLRQEKTMGSRFDRLRAVDVGDDLDCSPPAKRHNISSSCSFSGTSNGAISWKKNSNGANMVRSGDREVVLILSP